MKITVDTNVLITATFWNGDSNIIIGKAEKKEIELVLSMEILKEFSKVLAYKEIQDKIRNKNLEMKRTVEKVAAISTIVEPTQRFAVVKEDSDDNKFIECAKAGNVDFIISKDNHLLKIKEFEGIKIITSKEFLKIIKCQQ
ncbi:putative toxin-antitoxin system toxin component, PIN family [Candidatus Woesearchaeota archaeon]|nr:putative toxin-antitoxin system toxin component, PIN family [Candidatus Woesearchaeota archaeon]